MEASPEPVPPVRTLWEAFGRWHDPQTRLKLIEHYMPLAKIIAAKMYGLRIDQSISFDDYLQYARVGLMESIDRYDVSRGIAFESYATHRIRGAVLNGLGHESEAAAQRDFWRTRMPDRMESLVAGAGKDTQHASLGDLIEITVGIALGVLLEEAEVVAVDESPQSNPYAATELEQFSRALRSLVDKLPDREREIVHGHYFEHMEFQVIAQRYSVSKGRVSQLHARALARLRELLDECPRLDTKL